MSDYSFIILAQSAAVLTWLYVVKRNRRQEIPEFDSWLFSRLRNDSSVTIEKAFDEYIRDYHIYYDKTEGEPEIISQARRKLQLIEQYHLDEIYSGNELFENYKRKLQKTVNLLPQAVYLN